MSLETALAWIAINLYLAYKVQDLPSTSGQASPW
jgi:hypothetical protein